MLSSLASRLARLDRQCGPEERERIAEVSGGASIGAISQAIVNGLDPDRQVAKARSMFDVPAGEEPTERQVQQAATTLLKQAAEPIATRPVLRHLLQDIKRQMEQLIDDISVDELIEAGASEEAKQKAKALVDSFERFIADNRDEIDADEVREMNQTSFSELGMLDEVLLDQHCKGISIGATDLKLQRDMLDDVLRDDGLSYQDYLEQLTFLLFLKMADERERLTGERQPIPAGHRWGEPRVTDDGGGRAGSALPGDVARPRHARRDAWADLREGAEPDPGSAFRARPDGGNPGRPGGTLGAGRLTCVSEGPMPRTRSHKSESTLFLKPF